MIDRVRQARFVRFASGCALVVLGLGGGVALSGCAQMSDGMSTAFADPAQYDLYDCPQLETARKALDTRSAELQGLMAKAETGFAGPVVAEMAYRNDYIAIRGQAKFAEEAWQRNKCRETPPAPAKMTAPMAGAKPTAGVKPMAAAKKGAKPRSGAGVY
jgi:hypothetical protein